MHISFRNRQTYNTLITQILRNVCIAYIYLEHTLRQIFQLFASVNQNVFCYYRQQHFHC